MSRGVASVLLVELDPTGRWLGVITNDDDYTVSSVRLRATSDRYGKGELMDERFD